MDENAEKRVALAKDVLAQLAAKKIFPEVGTYLHMRANDECHVCALGSLVVACCGIEGRRQLNCDAVVACLRPVFDADQLVLIEAAFENDAEPPTLEIYSGEDDDLLASAADSIGPIRYAEDEEGDYDVAPGEAERRMRWIMQNIIDHNGTFVPEAP